MSDDMSKVSSDKLGEAVGLIGCPGDFQLAPRALWRRAAFDLALLKRNVVDYALHAAWLNQGATICVPADAAVLHARHVAAKASGSALTNLSPTWRFDGGGRVAWPVACKRLAELGLDCMAIWRGNQTTSSERQERLARVVAGSLSLQAVMKSVSDRLRRTQPSIHTLPYPSPFSS